MSRTSFNIVGIIVIVIVIVIVLLLRKYRKSALNMGCAVESDNALIDALPLPTARTLALELLHDDSKFRVEHWPDNASCQYLFPACVKELCAEYSKIYSIKGETVIDFTTARQWVSDNKFIIIGTDVMHASILILPLDEFVYVLDDDEYSDDEINDSRYASIYHYIIHVAKDLYDIPI